MKECNEILRRTIDLTEKMVELADLGDGARKDVGCGVLYGLLRDSAYKIRKVAEQEKEDHVRKGTWPREETPRQKNSRGEFKRTVSKREIQIKEGESECNPKTTLRQ